MEKRCIPPPEELAPEDLLSHSLCPNEFKMRIMIGILNGIEYDLTTSGKYS